MNETLLLFYSQTKCFIHKQTNFRDFGFVEQKSTNEGNVYKRSLSNLNNYLTMNPKSPEARSRDDKPFIGMKIADSNALECLETRSACTKCGKSRMYFCYTCFVPVRELEGLIPQCKLPIKVDIIKHRREIDGKSTAAHAAVLAPDDVNIFTYPDIPDYKLDGKTILLYPGVEAKTVFQLFDKNVKNTSYSEKLLKELPSGYNVGTLVKKIFNEEDNDDTDKIFHVHDLPIERVVLIDSTWNQSRGIFSDDRLQRLPKVLLQKRASQFWRHQKGSPRWYLSTVEALHQLVIELHVTAWGCDENYLTNVTDNSPIHNPEESHSQCKPYKGQYDNLLYFFKYMYEKLHTLYKHEDLLAYKRPMNVQVL